MLFVEKLTVFSVLRIITLTSKVDTIWYFEPTDRMAGLILSALRSLRIIRADVSRVKHHIGHVVDENGATETLDTNQRSRRICKVVRHEKLTPNPLISRMGSLWSSDKVVLHFEKDLEVSIRNECKRIALADWIQRTQASAPLHESFLLIQCSPWISYLKAHASEHDIRLKSYPGIPPNTRFLVMAVRFGFTVIAKSPAFVFRSTRRHRMLNAHPALVIDQVTSSDQDVAMPAVGIQYSFRNLTFDPAERSEFSWLMESDIPQSRVVLYGYQSRQRLDQATGIQLQERGVKLLGKGPDAITWLPTVRILPALITTGVHLLRAVFGTLIRLKPVSPYYLITMINLGLRYAFWYDLYSTHRIKVNVGTPGAEVAQMLALDSLGAVSTGYQRSVSNIDSPTSILCSGEDVQFVFSRMFEDLYRGIESPTKDYMINGMMNGHRRTNGHTHPDVASAETQLKASGATFIISYFDENSIDRWNIPVSNESTTKGYEYLLEWLLDEPTLGFIIKPKLGHDLFQRISRIEPLIERALATGRCVFLNSGHTVGNLYPASIARSSNLCIGHLAGATAALECRMAGVPTILIDSERYLDHPFWSLGAGSVVFEDWPALRRALEEHRENPDAYPSLGDWGNGINKFDPFLDGCADLRIGRYIQHLSEAIASGLNKDQAIAEASRLYADEWGIQNISSPKAALQEKESFAPTV